MGSEDALFRDWSFLGAKFPVPRLEPWGIVALVLEYMPGTVLLEVLNKCSATKSLQLDNGRLSASIKLEATFVCVITALTGASLPPSEQSTVLFPRSVGGLPLLLGSSCDGAC